jgi:hypothetical protein
VFYGHVKVPDLAVRSPDVRVPRVPVESDHPVPSVNDNEQVWKFAGRFVTLHDCHGYFGHPQAGFFFAKDFVTAAPQLRSILSVSGFGPGVAAFFRGRRISAWLILSADATTTVCKRGGRDLGPRFFGNRMPQAIEPRHRFFDLDQDQLER